MEVDEAKHSLAEPWVRNPSCNLHARPELDKANQLDLEQAWQKRVQLARLRSKLRTQRNRLAHTQNVSINDSLACLQILKEMNTLATWRRGEDTSTAIVECITETRYALNELSLLPKGEGKIKIGFAPCQRGKVVLLRLMLSSPKELIGRQEVLSKLLSLTGNSSGHEKVTRFSRVLLHGPPGIGKTAVVRKLASLLPNIYHKQFSFEAQSEASLTADICSFLMWKPSIHCNEASHSIFSAFKQHLSESNDSLFLIFENVPEPESVMSLLPPDKHCVIMTSSTDQPWRKLNLIPSQIFSIQLGPLDDESAFVLFKQTFTGNSHRNYFDDLCWDDVKKENLRGILSECLLGLPLAIRSFAFQLCEEENVACDFLLLINRSMSLHRTRSDERAAGRVHVRGFFHVVRYTLQCLSSDESALEVCLLLSLLPSCQTPVWFIISVGRNLGLSVSKIEHYLTVLSKQGLIIRRDQTYDMHRVIQHYVRTQITHQKSSVLDSVITAAVKTFEDETFTAFQDLLSDESSCQIEPDHETKLGRHRMTHGNINQAYINLQVEIIITAFLENVEPLKLDWALLDRCLCCLLQCCLRRDPLNVSPILACRQKIFQTSSYFGGRSIELRNCGSKKAFLNVLSLRWGNYCVFRPETFWVIYFEIVQCLVKEDSADLIELLRCAAVALLSSRAWNSEGTYEKNAGLIVAKLFASFGITPDILVERLRSSNDHRICSLALWLVTAFTVSGQRELAERLLISLIAIWAQRWQTFTVGNKEEFVNHILGVAYACICGGRKNIDRCLYWCDVAFRVNNINTACSKTFHLSLRACWRATWALCFQSVWQKRRHSIQVVQMWLKRLVPFLHLPNVTVECCRHLSESFVNLLIVSFISFGANFSLTQALLGLTCQVCLKSVRTPIYRGRVLLKDVLGTLLLLSSQARRPDDLNLKNIRRFCQNAAKFHKEIAGSSSNIDMLEFILEQTSLWRELGEGCRMQYFSFHALAASFVCRNEPKLIFSNPFILDSDRKPAQTNAPRTSKPCPAVFREAVVVFVDELRRCNMHKSADAICEALKAWPKPEDSAKLNTKWEAVGVN